MPLEFLWHEAGFSGTQIADFREMRKEDAKAQAEIQKLMPQPQVQPGNSHVYAQYTIRVPRREEVAEQLKAKGIPTAVYYPKCLHEQPVFSSLNYRWGDFPQAEKASREVLSLPMHPFLSQEEQDRIAGAVTTVLKPSRANG